MIVASSSTWNSTKLTDVAEIVMGQAPESESYNTDGRGLPLIAGAADLGEVFPKPKKFTTTSVKRSQKGDIILCVRATIGDLNWADGEYCYGRGVAGIRANSKISPEFLFHWLALNADYLRSIGRGATFKQISKTDIADLRVPLPPLDDQHRIVGRIKECLSRVEEIKRLREEAQREAEAIFSSALSGLVTADWPLKTLGSLAIDIRNGWSGKEATAGVSAKVLRLSSVHSRTIDPSESKEVVLSESARQDFRVVKGDVFIVRGNGSKHLVGRSAMAAETYDDIIFSDLLIRVRFNSEAAPKFVHYVLHSPFLRRQIEERAKTAAGIWKVNQTHLSGLEIPCPAIPQQTAFIEKVEQTAEVCGQLLTEINSKEIELISQAVLRKAFAGEL